MIAESPLVLGTVTGATGKLPLWVSLIEAIANYGASAVEAACDVNFARTGTKTLGDATLSSATLNAIPLEVTSKNLGVVTFAAGEALLFSVTLADAGDVARVLDVDVTIQLGSAPIVFRDAKRFRILQKPARIE